MLAGRFANFVNRSINPVRIINNLLLTTRTLMCSRDLLAKREELFPGGLPEFAPNINEN